MNNPIIFKAKENSKKQTELCTLAEYKTLEVLSSLHALFTKE